MRVVVVAGPPGAGKTTFVEKNRRSGDVILDRDRLWSAFSCEPLHIKPPGLFPLVESAFRAVLGKLGDARTQEDLRTVWIVTGAARCDQRQEYRDRFDAEVLVFEIPASSCLKHIAEGEGRCGSTESWAPIIHKWWKQYEPDPKDKIVRETD